MKLNNIGEVLKRKFIVERENNLKFTEGKFSKKDKVKMVLNDIEKNHNHSWFKEIYIRNKNNKEKYAMFFRGNKITYGEFFELVKDYSKALKYYGIKKGDEFVACLRQTPDYPILVAAASLIGAKVNLIAADFDKDYIAQIINKAGSKIVLIDDWDFSTLEKSLVKSCDDKKIVVLPVSKWDKYSKYYKKITEMFFKFDEKEYKNSVSKFNNVISVDSFLENGKKYIGKLNGNGKLTDELAITYTSGSTSKGIHKAVAQRNQTYIIMGRFHDSEVSGIPSMKNIVTLSEVGPHADTTLMTGVSDTLMQGGTIALDPIIDENYFLYSLKINKAQLVIATRTFWMRAMKETYNNPLFENLSLPYLYVPSEGGEPLSAGEEKALNKWLKDVKAGTAITHTPFSVAKMTVGGGDSEHGSIFLSLYRDYKNYLQKIRGIHEPIGLKCFDFVDLKVLRENGTYCNTMEMGRLVANAPISMEKYHNNPDATKKYFVTDAYGKKWGDLSCYGYVDKWKNVYIKGRIGMNDPKIKTFEISDEITRDTKNIMSCEVIVVNDNQKNPVYVAHIETQFQKNINVVKTLLSAENRCRKRFGNNVCDNLYFRLRSHQEGFPTLFTAKRNLIALKEEGLTDKCFIPSKTFIMQNEKQKKLVK